MSNGNLGSRLFGNPGQRIKDLATGIFVMVAILGLIGVFSLIGSLGDNEDYKDLVVVIAIVAFLFDVALAYCSALLVYGFGELITNTGNMHANNQPIQPIQPIQATVNPIKPADELRKFADLLEAGALTREEFENQKRKLGF